MGEPPYVLTCWLFVAPLTGIALPNPKSHLFSLEKHRLIPLFICPSSKWDENSCSCSVPPNPESSPGFIRISHAAITRPLVVLGRPWGGLYPILYSAVFHLSQMFSKCKRTHLSFYSRFQETNLDPMFLGIYPYDQVPSSGENRVTLPI